jgi:hypothetical protein
MTKTINIGSDFSRFPGGRFRSDGPHNGQQFREDHLVPALESDQKVAVILDEAVGLPASFLEEAFGGLVRNGYSPDILKSRLEIVARTPRMQRYPALIWNYISVAANASRIAV